MVRRVSKQRLWLGLALTIMIAAVSAWFIAFRPAQPASEQASDPISAASNQSDVEQDLIKAAAKLNENGPQKVDVITTFERATAGKRTLTYHYRIKAQASQREKLRQGVLQNVLPQICIGSTREFMKRTGIAYEYRLDSKEFSEPLSIIVDEQTCAIMLR